MMDGLVDKLAYGFLACFWIADAYILFVYSKAIREVSGKEAENELIKTWAMTWVFEQFGYKAFKLMMVRSAGRYFAKKYDAFMTGKRVFDVVTWYEGYILEALPFQFESPESDDFFGAVAN
ncbi:hypothetical protein CYMTET_45940 [Cymbomonas tetramitiformis]|uniref:Uncharacterized protein n=1 Tax=Cymbomonas tetramitiformis TaxID=36881 RepID=A0AAE0EXJ3_9CHLO|nr:hypothetical protein CYMTET_45940 [Cymbomonas tetramitiformis]